MNNPGSKFIQEQAEKFSANMDALFYQATDEKKIITHYLNIILANSYFDRGIDIGAGPGLLSEPLYSRCEQLTLLELLPIYKKELTKKFPKAQIEIGNILNYQFRSFYDVILFSHMLYYIPENQWYALTEKIFNYLANNGVFILILLDTRWVFDLYSESIGKLDVWSIDNELFMNQLKHFAKVESISYETETVLTSDLSIVNYLTSFFHLSNSSIIENNKALFKQFKKKLIQRENSYILKFSGNIILLRRPY